MAGDPQRARRWRRNERTATMAVLSVLFVAAAGWGLVAGWGVGSVAAMATFAVLTGSVAVSSSGPRDAE